MNLAKAHVFSSISVVCSYIIPFIHLSWSIYQNYSFNICFLFRGYNKFDLPYSTNNVIDIGIDITDVLRINDKVEERIDRYIDKDSSLER